MNPAAICPDARPRVPRILAVDDSELMHRLLRTRLQLLKLRHRTHLGNAHACAVSRGKPKC